MKNETIEEVAEKLTKDFPHYSVRENMSDPEIKEWFLEALQIGAELQAEKMYSEEEVLQLLLRLQQTESYDNLYDWFEQFKKK